MTLITRLLVFFLTMLTVVLLGFSASLYLMADRSLHRQVQERENAVISTLMAAVEAGPEGMEWEPRERHLDLGSSLFGEEVVWLVRDENGQLLDRSQNPATAEFLAGNHPWLDQPHTDAAPRIGESGHWLVQQRWLKETRELTDDSETKAISAAENGRYHASLSLTVAVSLLPVQSLLRQLAATLIGLSSIVWLIALVAGWFVCQRALRPVRQMASAAREMNGADVALRLPSVATGDELQELNAAFNGLLERLHDSFARQQRFTGDASHQLRTPLAAILGQVEVAQRRERSVEEYQRILAIVHERADHLTKIVESLLFLARSDAESHLPDREPINLRTWLPEYISLWKEHPRYGDLSLEMAADADPTIVGHAMLLGEMLGILIDNACKFSPAGTPIRIRLETADSQATIRIEDHGEGVAAEDLPQLGQPFFCTDKARQRGIAGAGLGLSIAKRLAGVSGGTLEFTSRPGAGCTVSVRLPLVVRESGAR